MVWTGATKKGGYGYIRRPGTTQDLYVHRVVYEMFVGAIDGLELHHTCVNKGCVNPDHLEELTRLEHVEAHRAPLCPNGHDDWRYETDSQGYRHRYCAICKRARVNARYHRLRPQTRPRFLGGAAPMTPPSRVSLSPRELG